MRGATLLELLSVLAIIGIVSAVAYPPLARGLDRAAVNAAADRYAITFEAARHLAVSRGRFSRLDLDTVQARVAVLLAGPAGTWDTLRAWSLGDVTVAASQPAVAFSPLGMAWGLSNSRIVVTRAAAAETLTVSRTGRLKRR